VPAHATLSCEVGGSGDEVPQVTSSVSFPLTRALTAQGANGVEWQQLDCPFSGPNYSPNNCDCSTNVSFASDALVHLEVASPDASDNSVWCFSSGGEDLCSFTWNGGEGDAGTCTFFLPAGEMMSCKMQFGTVDIVNALWVPLSSPIFAKTAASKGSGGLQPTAQRHWDRLIGYDPFRGPVDRLAHVATNPASASVAWAEFKRTHRKTHSSAAEEAERRRNFEGSLIQIARLRRAHPEARFGLSEHSDLSPLEWLDRSTSLRRPSVVAGGFPSPSSSSSSSSSFASAHAVSQDAAENVGGAATARALFSTLASAGTTAKASLPRTEPVDWRQKGKVVAVKDQGKCGNCWAFSATAAIESHWAIAGNPLQALSEEFLTDCNYPQAPGGCSGGFDQTAFAFVIANGIDSEASYPYTAGATGKSSNCTRYACADK
jgi:hypothetical protein